MALISVTRLRLRSVRFLPAFVMQSWRAARQLRRAPGFRGGSLMADRGLTFWTLTAWDGETDMVRFMSGGAHRQAMRGLVGWCDEAGVVHWKQGDAVLPNWAEADQRLRADGRASTLRYPGTAHATLSHEPPRSGPSLPIKPPAG